MFKDIDLEDPQIEQALHQLTLSSKADRANPPTRTVCVQSSREDRRADPDNSGSRDKVVQPIRTQRLINGFVNRLEYHEIDAGHDLVDPRSGAWDQVKERIVIFAASLPR